MKIQCEYCGNYISDTDVNCPVCGAPNLHLATSAAGIPKTIGELIAFCDSHKIPCEQMRFFLGKDYRQPKAFGIFQDTDGNFVVYKNKADGSRVVRYRGKDEAYAVNEIYQKMRAEVSERKEAAPGRPQPTGPRPSGSPSPSARKRNRVFVTFLLIFIAVSNILITSFFVFLLLPAPRTGYYDYNQQTYYHNNSGWYVYNDGWSPATIDEELSENYDNYYESFSYDDSYGIEDFRDSEYSSYSGSEDSGSSSSGSYSSSWDDDDDWDDDDWDDDDWDYDYDSWDSGDSDWDSDW